MASYNAAINIVVSGQQRLDYVLNSVEKLNAITQKLKPINLLAPGAGAGGDAVRAAKKQLDDFARAVINFKPEGIQKRAKELSTTMAGAAEQAAALTTALANVGLKSGGFREQAAEVKNYALALDTAARNAARLNAIGRTVQRGARVENIATRFNVAPEQVEQRLANIREAASKRQAKLDEAERQRDVQKFLALKREEDFELRLGRILERNAAAKAKRTRQSEGISNAIIGGAFPLLFGQGPGAAIGGGVGGFAGGLAGGQLGFGLSLVGTAVGASFDALSQSSVDFAKALRQGGDAATYLETTLGYLDPTLKKQIQNLQSSGQVGAAADLAFQELARTVGKDGAEAFLELGKRTEAGTLSLKRIAASFIAAGLASNKFFSDIKFGKNKDFTELLPEQFRPGPTPTADRETAAFRQRTAELSKNNQILRLQVELTSLSARNDLNRFVTIQKQIATKEYENELTKIAIQLKNGEINLEQNKLQITAANLDLSKKLGDIERTRVEELARRQQQSAQAAEEAQRKAEATLRAQFAVQKSVADERLKNLDIIIEESKFTEGEETALRRSLQLTEARGKLIEEALYVERETALQEAAKNNTTQQTVKLYDQKLKNAQNELNLQTAITERQLDQLQIQKELDRFERQRRLEQDLAGLQLPGDVSPLEQLTRTQAGRREQLLGPRFEELDLLQTRLAARTGTFTDDQIKEYRNRLVEVNNEIGRLTDGLAQVDAAEITWERNKAGAEALQNVLNGLGSTVMDVFSSLITNTNDFNSSLSNALRSLSNLLLQATISGLAGTDGVGFFSFLAGGLGRRAAGGPVANRTPYIVGERGPELFVPNSSGTIVPNNQLGGMGGDVSVVVNVDANGSQVQGNENQAKALGGAISAAVQAEIVKQQRPGGLLAGTR